MAKDIEKYYSLFQGFVILHGTDTMAYTASALSFMLQNLGKPVIMTGSQVMLTHTHTHTHTHNSCTHSTHTQWSGMLLGSLKTQHTPHYKEVLDNAHPCTNKFATENHVTPKTACCPVVLSRRA